MFKVKRWVWALLVIIGMILLAVGAFGVTGIIPLGIESEIMMAAGIIIMALSSAVIQLMGSKLKKEFKEFERFEQIRNDALLVPNNLKEGYVIDYTAEPSRAICYRNNEPEPEEVQVKEEEEEDDSESDILIVYSS
jgi:hypothetical protein